MERVIRFELMLEAWKAAVLPLHHTRAVSVMYLQTRVSSREELFFRKLFHQKDPREFSGVIVLRFYKAVTFNFIGIGTSGCGL